jgi:hypothetical protein
MSLVSLHTPVLHWSPDPLQSRGDPPQTPAVHTSSTLQNNPSSQEDASASGVSALQLPSSPFGSHEAELHWSPADEQSGAWPPEHRPLWHVSAMLQAFPSLHAVPSAIDCAWHTSFFSLHVPMLHWSPDALQSCGLPPQTPSRQTSSTVQNNSSSHAVPSSTGRASQAFVPSLQTPVLH